MAKENQDMLAVLDALSTKRVAQLRGSMLDPQPQVFVAEGNAATFLLVRNPHRVQNGHLREALQHAH